MQRLDPHPASLVRRLILARQAVGHRRHVRLGLLDRDAWLHPADGLQRVDPAQRGTSIRRQQPPDARLTEQLKSAGNDADNRVGLAVELNVAADDARIAVEARPPEPFAHDNGVGATIVVFLRERPADDRLHPEHVEKARHDPLPRDRLGRAVFAVHDHAADTRDEASNLVERAIAFHPVEQVERRHPAPRGSLLLFPQHDQPIGRRKRQRPQQRRVHQREDGAVGSNPEGQRDDRHGGKARRAPELSQSKLHVIPELVEPLHQPHVAIPFSAEVHTGPFEVRQIAKPFGRLPSCGRGVDAAIDQLARAHFEVEGQFLVHLLVNGNSPQP